MVGTKITVVTPSVRKENLDVIEKCLCRQTFREFEWLVGSPEDWGYGKFVQDPPKRAGDYYSLNASWNAMFKKARGELIVSIQDGIWFDPQMLENFWNHYQANPKACVGAIGHQYDQVVNGKPENLMWRDPRARTDQGTFHEITPTDLEWCVCAFPKQAIFDIGGIDEEYDKYAAISEKDANFRMSKLGYKFYLDQSIEYRAIHHPRLNAEWEERYQAGCKVFLQHGQEIVEGKRLKLNYLH